MCYLFCSEEGSRVLFPPKVSRRLEHSKLSAHMHKETTLTHHAQMFSSARAHVQKNARAHVTTMRTHPASLITNLFPHNNCLCRGQRPFHRGSPPEEWRTMLLKWYHKMIPWMQNLNEDKNLNFTYCAFKRHLTYNSKHNKTICKIVFISWKQTRIF